MVNEDADSRPISVSELLARHQAGADAVTPAGKDGRNRRRAGREGAVSLAELTGEVPRVASDPTAEPRHTSFPRSDRPGDGQPAASGMPAYGTDSENSAPEPADVDEQATGVIERVRETPDDFDSYRSFSDIEPEPEVKSRRGFFGRRRARDPENQSPARQTDEATAPTEVIGQTDALESSGSAEPADVSSQADGEVSSPLDGDVSPSADTSDRAEVADKADLLEKTDLLDKNAAPDDADFLDETDAPDETDVLDETDVPDPAELADKTETIDLSKPVGLGEFGDEVDVPEPAELTDDADLADKTEAIEKIELTDKTEAIEKIELADKTELTDKAELAGPVAQAGFATSSTGGSSEYLANLYSGSPASGGFPAVVGDLRPGETTEVIEPVRDEVPTAGEVPAAGADVQAPAGPDRPVPLWLTDPAPADSDPTDDGEQNTDASDAAGDPAEKPEIDAVTRAAQARAARVGDSAKKKRFGKKAAKAAIESASADDLDASAGGNALRFAGDGGPGDDAAGNDSSGDAKSVDKSATEKTSADKKKSADKKESGRADTGQEPSPAKAWLLVVGESLLGLAIGLGLFWGFKELWEWSVPFALVLAVVVIFSIVTVTHVVRRSRDLATTLLAVGVGLLVTIGPLVLLAT